MTSFSYHTVPTMNIPRPVKVPAVLKQSCLIVAHSNCRVGPNCLKMSTLSKISHLWNCCSFISLQKNWSCSIRVATLLSRSRRHTFLVHWKTLKLAQDQLFFVGGTHLLSDANNAEKSFPDQLSDRCWSSQPRLMSSFIIYIVWKTDAVERTAWNQHTLTWATNVEHLLECKLQGGPVVTDFTRTLW